MNGGRFDFDDGGTYCGGWEEGKAHGHGVCTGPKSQGEYSGAWHYGFEVSGIYTWPSGNTYEGQWQNGKRHGLGVERRGRWIYRGEWTQGYKGRYGVRQSTNSQAKYEGTWSSGLQDGYGTETYADGGTFQGQWLRGMRHGYGVRKSAPYGVAAKYRSRSHAHASLTSLRSDQGDEQPTGLLPQDKEKRSYADEGRGGFVLRARSEPPVRRRSLSERSLAVKSRLFSTLRITKQRSTGDIHQRVKEAGTGSLRSSGSTTSCASDESAFGHEGHDGGGHLSLAEEEFVDPGTIETYMGEWKNDKRSGFGISERSDGLRYEGEWFNNKKFGYGCTTQKDGTKEEGKYKNNFLVTSQRKKHLLFVRSSKLRERIDAAVNGANRAAQIALQKADIGISRTATAKDRAEQGDYSAMQAKEDSDVARICAKQFDPTFKQPGTEVYRKQRHEQGNHVSYPLHPPSPSVGPSAPAQPTAPLLPEHGGPHNRSRSLYIPQSRTVNAKEEAEFRPEEITPPMETPPSEMTPSTSANQHFEQTLSSEEEQLTPLDHDPHPSSSFDPSPPLPPPSPSYLPPSPHHTPPSHFPPPDQPFAPTGGTASRPSSFDQTVHPRDLQIHTEPPVPAQHQYRQPPMAPSPSPPMMEIPHLPTDYVYPQHPQANTRDLGVYNMGEPEPGTSGDAGDDTSSRFSINMIMNDHFDQYTMAANPGAAKLFKANLLRTPASVAQPTDQPPAAKEFPPGAGSAADEPVHIVRRSTLASTRDWQGLPGNFQATNPPLKSALPRVSAEAPAAPTGGEGLRERAGVKSGGGGGGGVRLETIKSAEAEEIRGSLPDLCELDKTPVHMTREDASRLSSQRRQELVRMHEEEEVLRGNPLRYLFHPTVRAWFARWKLPLLVLLVNVCLSVLFYQLLTYQKDNKD